MQHMITTVDNPYNPFNEYDKWDSWDRSRGYCSSAYLARVVVTSEDLSEADQMLDIERGIDDILEYDEVGVYRKVSQEVDVETRISVLVGEADASE
mgnify:FL=1